MSALRTDHGALRRWPSYEVCVTLGDALPSHDFPLLARLYLEGKLELERTVTRTIALDQVEDAFRQMHTGNVIRSVIALEQATGAGRHVRKRDAMTP